MSRLIPFFVVLCLALPTLAQPPGPGGGGPPGVGPGSTVALPPHFIGIMDRMGSKRLTVRRDTGSSSGALSPRMDFRTDDQTFLSPGLKKKDRVLVLYETGSRADSYKAKAVVRFPSGSSPQEIIDSIPKQKR